MVPETAIESGLPTPGAESWVARITQALPEPWGSCDDSVTGTRSVPCDSLTEYEVAVVVGFPGWVRATVGRAKDFEPKGLKRAIRASANVASLEM